MTDSFLTDFNKEKLDAAMQETQANLDMFTEVSSSIVKEYTSDLDTLMTNLHSNCISQPAPDNILEMYLLELNSLLYFIGDRLESMGVRDDLSKLAAKEVFNNSYLDAPVDEKGKKPTVAEITAIAENDSRYETILNNIYSRAYKQIKFKVEAGYDMINTLRKIMSKRMQDQQLAAMAPSSTLTMGE